MIRLSGRFRSALTIGIQGIRARKLRTLLSMVSLFLGVLAVVVVQTGASVAERAFLADVELTSGVDGTRMIDVMPHAKASDIVTGTLRSHPHVVAMAGTSAIVGEQNVRPLNEGGMGFDEEFGGACQGCGMVSDPEAPQGQAIELQMSALTGDVREFRPFRVESGRWLDFATVPSLSPQVVLNATAAKGFAENRVPAEMRLASGTANVTPRIIGVVDDGDSWTAKAYVRMDELSNWLVPGTLGGGQNGMGWQVYLRDGSPAAQILDSKLRAAGVESYSNVVQSKAEMAKELEIIRLIFLGLAGLILLIGVAGILNVGLATVGERVEEFALRRAVGTPRALLAGIVLAETLLTGLFTAGLAIGVSAGALSVASDLLGSSEPMMRDLQFPWEAGVAGVVGGVIAGRLGGRVPALRAAPLPLAPVMGA